MSGEQEHGGTATGEGRPPLRTGSRLAGRYRITETLPSDLLAERYRAEDEASARSVLVRVPLVEACPDDASRRKLLSALGSRVGVHGRYFGGVLDAGEDERRAYLVEPDPEGVALARVIAKRFASNARFTPEEVLPVAARIAAALDALPEGMAHGEVDADRVVVNADGITLLGGGLAAALPGSALRRVVTRAGAPRFAAPEWSTGTIGRPADVFGLGCIVARMLVGDVEPRRLAKAAEGLGAVGVALAAMLTDDPQRRARTSRPLLDALARHAGLPVPELDSGATAPKKAPLDTGGFDDESTVMMPLDELGAHASRTSSLGLDDDDDVAEPREEDKTRQISLRLVGEATIDDLSRSGAAGVATGLEETIDLADVDDLEEEDDTPADGIPLGALDAAAPDVPLDPLPPPRLGFSLAEPPTPASRKAAPAEPAASAPRARPPAQATPAPKAPAALPPPPKPAVPPASKGAAAGRPLPPPPATPPRAREEPPPATRPERSTPVPTIDVSPLASIPEAPKRRGDPTARRLPTIPAPRPAAVAPRAQGKILGIAVGIAIAIILASFGVATWRRHSEASERERRLRERFEELQRETADP